MNVVRPEVPAGLAAVVSKMMAKAPSARYQTPGEAAKALAPFFRSATPKAAGPPDSVRTPQVDRTVIETESMVRRAEAKEGLALAELDTDEGSVERPRVTWPWWLLAVNVVAVALVLGYGIWRFGKPTTTEVASAPTPSSTKAIPPGPVFPDPPPTPPLTRPEAPIGDPGVKPDVSQPKPANAGWVGAKAGDLKVLRVKDQEIRLRWCPPGEFQMGSPIDEAGRSEDEGPVQVRLTKGFWLMETEFTQGLWLASGGSRLKWDLGAGPNLPVYNVDWKEAVACAERMAAWLRDAGQLPSNMKVALPTEAQWEYACRAGEKARFSFGDDESKLGDYAWFFDNRKSGPQAVGGKKANNWGFRDMAGNVYEWCSDGYDAKLPGGVDPFVAPREAPYRVNRGGSWDGVARCCRAAFRRGSPPVVRASNLGFRVAAGRE